MTLYSEEVRRNVWRYIATRKWPDPQPIVEIRETEDRLMLTLYRDNFNRFDGEDKLQIANQTKDILEKINADGIPLGLQVLPGDGSIE